MRVWSVLAISIHNTFRIEGLKSQNHLHFKMPFESSNLPGAGPVCPD